MAAEEKWYFTRKQLENSPSRKCDIDSDKELSYRQQAANFIQDVGQRLQVTQLCINTAIVYMHRFYVFHSFTQFHRYSIASAALFLAAKVEEQPRKLEHVIKVAHVCLHKESAEGSTPAPDVKSEQYAQLAHELVFNENVLLQTLGFDVAIDHPHTHVVRCCHLVKASKDLAQTSYFLASNSLHLTTMCLQYKPTVVACFCIHLACKWSNWEIPPSSEGKPWFTYVDESVTTEMLDELTKEFITIYNKCPSRLKKKIQSMSASLGQSSNSGINSTPNSSSSTSSMSSSNLQQPAPPSKCNSPMTVDGKKIQMPQQHSGKELSIHYSKAHHNQTKPVPPNLHRPPHDPNINYNEYKEKKERERNLTSGGVGVHYKPLPSGQQDVQKHGNSQANHKHNIPPGASSMPSHNRNPHHRNLDPKLKMHPHASSSSSSSSGSGSNRPSNTAPNQMIPNARPPSSNSGGEHMREQLHRDYRDPYRDYNRIPSQQRNDMTAPRDQSLSAAVISSERELAKEQQMRERHNAGGNAANDIMKDNLFREMKRDRPPSNSELNRELVNQNNVHKHRVDLFNKDSNNSVGSDVNNDKHKQFNLNKLINNVPQNIKHESSSNINNSSRHKSSKELSDLNKLHQSNAINKKTITAPAVTAPSIVPPTNKVNYTQQLSQQSQLNKPLDNQNLQHQQLFNVPTSSPTTLMSMSGNEFSRNGDNDQNIAVLSPISTSAPPQKYKSIFSPEKELPKTPTKKQKTGKTPPSGSKDTNMLPPALSPFGSPPPSGNTNLPTTPTSSIKNRNRTSSSSSEPELVVVCNKLENIKGYEHIMKTGMKIQKDNQDRKGKVKEEIDVKPTTVTTNGIETTDPTVISNLLKEVTPINHLSVVDSIKKEEENVLSENIAMKVSDDKKSEHHKSKKKKDKHKHKEKDRNREDKEKKKKHKDKDRERSKSKSESTSSETVNTPPMAPLKITIAKDKIASTELSGLKIKIPKERIKTETIPPNTSNSALNTQPTLPIVGGLKIKISKDKIVDNSEVNTMTNSSNSSRKRERDSSVDAVTSHSGIPPTKLSKSNNNSNSLRISTSAESNRLNGRNSSSFNNKQVSLGEGGQVGGVGASAAATVGVMHQQMQQWSTTASTTTPQFNKLAESKYHSKLSSTGSNNSSSSSSSSSNKQPPLT